MLTLKKALFAATICVASMGASAELVTPTQTQSFAGTAGSDSGQEGVAPFTFDMFDSALGTLTGITLSYDMSIDGGLIGADNITNDIVSGNGELGASLQLTSALPFLEEGSFAAAFTLIELVQTTTFTLSADPTMSVGGSGPDVFTLTGGNLTQSSGPISLASFFFGDFVGNAGDTFAVNFNSSPLNVINANGTQGFFQAPDMSVSVSLSYTYDEFPPELNDVSTPFGAALAGMVLLGAGLVRRRKQ